MVPTRTNSGAPATSTVTRIPTLTPSPTLTSSPSLTPPPVLNQQDAQKEIARLMLTNDDCSPGCFWGITPGKTGFDEAINALQRLGDKGQLEDQAKSSELVHYMFSYLYQGGPIGGILNTINIYGKEGITHQVYVTMVGLEVADITSEDWLAFRPDNTLKNYGVPNTITISFIEGPEGRVQNILTFEYDNMTVTYYGNQTIIIPEHHLYMCPNKDHNVDRMDMVLGSDARTAINSGYKFTGVDIRGKDITQVTSGVMTIDRIVQILTGDPSGACIDLDYNKYLTAPTISPKLTPTEKVNKIE